jgi:hypothetical protein
MLTITKGKQVTESVELGQLFRAFDLQKEDINVDADGDSILDTRDFGICVKSHDDDNVVFKRIEAFRWTKPETTMALILFNNTKTKLYSMICSPEHLVATSSGWKHAGDIDGDDEVHIDGGTARIMLTRWLTKKDRLCDLQVADTHCYFTNDILSHNSHALVHFGAEALLKKKNVIHYTFELSENAIGLRYDSHLTGIASNDIAAHKDDVIKIEDSLKLGKLIIKGYPTGTATIQTLRAHIERCILQGAKPDVLLIDYADIMRSTRKYDAPRFELKLIYEELRNLAMTFDIPIWTASQANRDASNSDIVGLENMSEAYGKAMVADVVLSLSRKPEEKSSGLGRLFVAKNRAGQDGIVYPVRINTATSTITAQEGADSLLLLESQQLDDQNLRDNLRKKWRGIVNDKSIPTRTLSTNDEEN